MFPFTFYRNPTNAHTKKDMCRHNTNRQQSHRENKALFFLRKSPLLLVIFLMSITHGTTLTKSIRQGRITVIKVPACNDLRMHITNTGPDLNTPSKHRDCLFCPTHLSSPNGGTCWIQRVFWGSAPEIWLRYASCVFRNSQTSSA